VRYLDDALQDVLDGKAARLAETAPVGCSVKYASK
jgi:hypothetical protein